MFNFFSNQTESNSVPVPDPDPVFATEKELLLHVIENEIDTFTKSKTYSKHALPEWKSQYSEKKDYAIKPMNCPAHVQIFNQGLKSYKDLPIKISEFGLVHRNEPSGTLHGLMRARQFVQDDAHIFCTESQLSDEIKSLIKMTFSVYEHFGFKDISIALSTRPEKRVGNEELWDKSENILKDVLTESVESFTIQDGEGAFYGPKIEF